MRIQDGDFLNLVGEQILGLKKNSDPFKVNGLEGSIGVQPPFSMNEVSNHLYEKIIVYQIWHCSLYTRCYNKYALAPFHTNPRTRHSLDSIYP